MYMRAMRHYKKALLDLETPCEWYQEEHIIERNQLRLQLHLNTALCGLKVPPERQFPNLQAPKIHFDPHHDAIFHCTRVLDVDKRNVKALYRRACAHAPCGNAPILRVPRRDSQHPLLELAPEWIPPGSRAPPREFPLVEHCGCVLGPFHIPHLLWWHGQLSFPPAGSERGRLRRRPVSAWP